MEISKANPVVRNQTLTFKRILSTYGIVIAFFLLCVVLSFTADNFLSSENLINVLRQISINGILAIGMTFVILTAGIDLSVGSVVALSGVVAASFAQGDASIWLAVLMGLLVGLVLGFINGVVVAKWGVASFIVTLAMMTIARGLTFVYSDGKPISGLSQAYLAIGKSDVLGIPIPVWILFITFALSYFVLYHTKFGRYVYAVGGNENAATVSGINVSLIKIMVFSISGLLAGLAGIVLSSRVSAGLPQAGISYELDAIAAVVIGGTSLAGGKGRLWGTLIGVMIIGVVNNGLDLLNVSSYYQQIVKGCIIVGAVLLDSKKSR
ncbi:ABC transporter permease [Brevibacillus marinus]|uniref:ABC transporter permease n=1 Tax=Brevibacillus marinus TaxID=2496837 RepID=UPI000F83DFD7|nr:ribose ABC transporter permease [Brevibacillus marinus]